jgi:hypothetical protein
MKMGREGDGLEDRPLRGVLVASEASGRQRTAELLQHVASSEALKDNIAMAGDAGPFSPEDLPTNQTGRLTDNQARTWQLIARDRRKAARSGAYLAGAIGVVLLIANGPASKAATREGLGIGCFGIALVILLASGRNALTADLREGRLDVVEGAIGKHFVQGRGAGGSTYYLDIAERHLRTSRRSYEAAPDAGVVRAYYLPRSRRLVNLEHLPDRPLPTGSDAPQQIVKTVINAIRRHDPVALAEARASAAAFAHAIEGSAPPAANAAEANDSRPLAEVLCGTWTNPLITVTFAPDGAASVTAMGGMRRVGRWSIDAGGRLLTDATGEMAPTDATVAGDHLTITVGERRMTFTRAFLSSDRSLSN